MVQSFCNTLGSILQSTPKGNAETKWSYIRDAIYNSAKTTFGTQDRQNPDWFAANILELEPVIAEKRTVLLNHKNNPSAKSFLALRSARSVAQKTARRCANDYWQELCRNIQLFFDTGNIRGVHEGIRKAFGPTIKKTAPLKTKTGEVLIDRKKTDGTLGGTLSRVIFHQKYCN
uniref:Uncharacterized protein n=1 Tax=Arion vulgaris TaxID=1028688 RepID=A0A0B7BSZ2_9EUPU